jgi:hypothetical protein
MPVLGRLKTARDFSSRAINLGERMEERGLTAIYQADAALREALFGNSAKAQQQAASALPSSNGRDVEYAAALALAFAGNVDLTSVLVLALICTRQRPIRRCIPAFRLKPLPGPA